MPCDGEGVLGKEWLWLWFVVVVLFLGCGCGKKNDITSNTIWGSIIYKLTHTEQRQFTQLTYKMSLKYSVI